MRHIFDVDSEVIFFHDLKDMVSFTMMRSRGLILLTQRQIK